ncbi:hypothetical protein [Pedobacter agri]|uniref:hypothetical protein n=1 Tax=Pedobacter agri TaxID=454586 RepID=UPI00292CAB76|nr:hypothetical protein [Pedobacter agri]
MMLYFEFIFLIAILAAQCISFQRSRQEIKGLKSFFPDFDLGNEEIIRVEYQGNTLEQIHIDYKVKEFNSMISSTNAYLLKNNGSADFNIIKSIADRSIAAQENKVSSGLSLPLYLGLMGTFIGVVLGLGSIALNGFDLQDTDLIIRELISGVVLAMLVSLLGLGLTTILNAVIYKHALAHRDIRRNHYLNFLQAELLPNLDNNLYSALDQFKSNISDFNSKFAKNLDLFDSSFNENIKNLKATVVGMSSQIEAVNRNTAVQLEFLQELRKIGYNRMAEANIRVFDKIKEVGPMMISFIAEQQKLTTNLQQANAFSERITALIDRVSSFEEGIQGLGRELHQSDLLGADMLALVKKHLQAIEQKEALVADYASKSTGELENYFGQALQRIQALKSRIEIDFEKAFDFQAGGNLMQNLKHLSLIGENGSRLNELIAQRDGEGIRIQLNEIIEINKKLLESRPDTVKTSTVEVVKPPRIATNKSKRAWWQILTFGKGQKNGRAK